MVRWTTDAPGRPAGGWPITARAWLPDAAVGAAVGMLGLLELLQNPYVASVWDPTLVIVTGFAVACALARRAPAVALSLVWVVCAWQVAVDVTVLIVQVTVGIVVFGAARWGTPATVLLSGLSIPAGLVVAVGVTSSRIYDPTDVQAFRPVLDFAYALADTGRVGFAVVAGLVLTAPWFAGLALRFLDRAQASRTAQLEAEAEAARAKVEQDRAEEVARLREGQTRLAADVHDVVGHSLAVILAQAESGQYLPDDDGPRLKHTLATIATSARVSLQDVRDVLASTRESPRTEAVPTRAEGLEDLIEGVGRGGHEVTSTQKGHAQPLPPDLATVAYRVLQEMLTNAIRHGRRDAPVVVERDWTDGLRLQVSNHLVDHAGAGPDPGGRGLDGMHRRLTSVGGTFASGPRDGVFVATAWLPVRR